MKKIILITLYFSVGSVFGQAENRFTALFEEADREFEAAAERAALATDKKLASEIAAFRRKVVEDMADLITIHYPLLKRQAKTGRDETLQEVIYRFNDDFYPVLKENPAPSKP